MMMTASTAKPATAPTPLTEPLTVERLQNSVQQMWTWLDNHSVEILIAAVAATLVYLGIIWLKGRARRFAENQADRRALPAIVGRTLARTGHIFALLVSIRLVSGFANVPAGLERVIGFLFTVTAVFQVAVWVREVILGLIERRAADSGHDGSETLANAMTLIRILVTVALFAVALIVVLDNLGVNVTGLVAGLGIGGIAIGLAAQGIFEDLFAALAIIFDQPFKRGETIKFGTTTATVEKIGLKSTRLRALTGEQVIIANKQLLAMEITNAVRTDNRRSRFMLGVTYQTSPEKMQAIPAMLQEIVERHDASFVRAVFTTFSPSSLDFQLDFDVAGNDPDSLFRARHGIGLDIVARFAAEGIDFAYPTQTTFTAAPDGQMVMPYATPAAPGPAVP